MGGTLRDAPRDATAWTGKRVLVLGLAKSGVAVAKLLHRLGAHVTVNDRKPREEAPEAAVLEALGIRVVCGGHPEGIVNDSLDLVVKNPGIPYRVEPVQAALALNLPIVTEVEIAYRLSKAPFVGITGSNGKTTTTTLVGQMLAEGKVPNVVAGNIGRALTDVAASLDRSSWLVAELSSFQLKGTVAFRPRVAALLNIIPAHLDYHETMDDYVQSKQKLLSNQTADEIAIVNADCAHSMRLAAEAKSRVWRFSRTQEVAVGTDVRDGWICFHEKVGQTEQIVPVAEIALIGQHNLENALAAVAIAKACGVQTAAIADVLRQFPGIEHRLEFVRELDGVRYYNDSKATNPVALARALESFTAPVVLIAGGLDRGIDFRELVPLFKERLHGLVVYGQVRDVLAQRGREAGVPVVAAAAHLRDAVVKARGMARTSDVVLLSPACASWDQFASFEERGGIFKQAVHSL